MVGMGPEEAGPEGAGPEGAGAEGLRGLGLLCHGGAASCPLRQGRSSGDTGRGGKED